MCYQLHTRASLIFKNILKSPMPKTTLKSALKSAVAGYPIKNFVKLLHHNLRVRTFVLKFWMELLFGFFHENLVKT